MQDNYPMLYIKITKQKNTIWLKNLIFLKVKHRLNVTVQGFLEN